LLSALFHFLLLISLVGLKALRVGVMSAEADVGCEGREEGRRGAHIPFAVHTHKHICVCGFVCGLEF